MLGIKLVLLLECSLQAFGLIVGGYSFILPSGQGVPETVINAIIEKDNVVNSRNENNEIEIVCAEQQLVEGMNYKVYFKPNEQDLCYTKVYYISWLNYLDVQELSCNAELSLPLGCKNLGRFSNRPKRSVRSVDVVSMSKVRFYNYDKQVKALFDEFIRNHQREYSESADSDNYQKRYEIFAQNYETAKMLNRTDKTAHYGITKFMDYSYDEFHMYSAPGFTKPLVDIRTLDLSGLDASAIPDSVDWRDQGAVTEVKNQGQCGSCWAFSTTGNIEGQWFLKHKKLYSLSEQELVDCDTLDSGCNGGLPSNAYKSIEKLGGLETESDYPYEGAGEKCSINKSEFKVTVNDSVALPKDENQLAAWLAKNGPISIGINANMMQFYFGGIAHPWKIFCNPKSLDHGVLIVGYGTEKGTPYWIIKNSWGPHWGEKGYYRIYRGDGSCGLNQMATSAIVN